MAAMNKSIEIFKAGKHTPISGGALQFSEADLIACANAYDPEVFKAPLVVGHPKLDDPAYGWVESLNFSESKLKANPEQVDVAFAELVNDGKFPKVSAAFYLPDSPNNPKPGVLYLKHIGFLGAAAPAIKGLKTVSFADNEQGVVEFADWDQMNVAWLFRNLRDFFIEKFGLDSADKILPAYQIENIQISAVQDNDDVNDSLLSSFSENDEMTPEQKAKMDALEAENATLKTSNTALQTQVASFAESAAAAKTAALHAEHVSFAESLVKEAKLAPANKEGAIALMDQLAKQETTVEFGEGDAKVTEAPLAVYKKQLSEAKPLVEFGEHEIGEIADDVSDDPALLAQKAVEFAESEAKEGRTVNSAEAVAHVKKTLAK